MSDFLSVSISLMAIDIPTPRMGPISGEISIAPITTAVEFALSPTEATKIEQIRGGSRLQFGEKSIMIYHWEMGAFEVEQFKLFLNKLEK